MRLLISATQQKTLHMDITRWSIPKSDWLYSLQPDIKKKKKKESRENHLTFRYDLNQIPYDYTVSDK